MWRVSLHVHAFREPPGCTLFSRAGTRVSKPSLQTGRWYRTDRDRFPVAGVFLDFKRCSKGRNDHDVIRAERFDRYSLRAIGIKQEPDALIKKVLIDCGVVNHLAEEINVFVGVLFYRPVGDVNCIFDSVAKSEVTWN